MSLDPLFLAAAATVAPASGTVLLTSSRTRFSARAFLAARRLLGGALLLVLLLAAVATFRWSDATMGASTSLPGAPALAAPGRPPLTGYLVLAALAWIAQAVAVRRRAGGSGASRLSIRRRGRLEQRAPRPLRAPRPTAAHGAEALGVGVGVGVGERREALPQP